MAVVKHGDGWWADWRDEFGRRRRKVFRTKGEAATHLRASLDLAEKGKTGDTPDEPDITLSEFAAKWLATRPAAGLDPSTIARHGINLKRILPRFGHRKVREMFRKVVRTFLMELLTTGTSIQGMRPGATTTTKPVGKRLARGSVRSVYHTLSAIMTEATEQGLVQANPLHKLWRSLSKAAKAAPAAQVKALSLEQTGAFLAAARVHAPDHHACFSTMLLSGVRPGEAMALTADKIDLRGRSMLIDAQVGQHGGLKSTKTGKGRQVELSAHLVGLLTSVMNRTRDTSAKVVSIAPAEPAPTPSSRPAGPWLFYPELGPAPTEKDAQRVYKNVLRAMRRSLAAAGLPQHHGLHALRHSYAVGLISRGVSPAFVQQQMGHASIEQTVGTYGSWFPVRVAGALDALAAAVDPGHQMDTSEASQASVGM